MSEGMMNGLKERQMGELSSNGKERVSGRVKDGDDYDTHAHPGKQ